MPSPPLVIKPSLVLSIALLICFGCSHHMSETDYVSAYSKIANDFQQYAVSLQDKALPIDQSLPADQRRQQLAKSMSDTADHFQKFADEEKALDAPQKFEGLHKAMLALYQGEADGWRKWSDATAKEDRAERERISNEMATNEVAWLKAVRDEAKKIDPSDHRLDAIVGQVSQEENTDSEFTQPIPKPRQLNKGDYLQEWTMKCYAYCNLCKQLKHPPLPRPGESKEEFGKEAATILHQAGNKMEILAKREESDLPPEPYQALHEKTIAFYRVQGQLWNQFADAYAAAKPPAEAKRIIEKLGSYPDEQIALMKEDAKKTPSAAALQQELEDMRRANPMGGQPKPAR